MFIEVLQTMDHYIRTAFGDPKRSYKGSIEELLQGIYKGYGLDPIECTSVCNPIVRILKEANLDIRIGQQFKKKHFN